MKPVKPDEKLAAIHRPLGAEFLGLYPQPWVPGNKTRINADEN